MSLTDIVFIMFLFNINITDAGSFGFQCPGSTFCSEEFVMDGGNPFCRCYVGLGGNPVDGCCNNNGECASELVCDTLNDVNTGSGTNYRCIQAPLSK